MLRGSDISLPQTLDFTDLPLDTRHIEGRIRNQRKGGHSVLTEQRRITLADFPKGMATKVKWGRPAYTAAGVKIVRHLPVFCIYSKATLSHELFNLAHSHR
jgi:hypothetical protein